MEQRFWNPEVETLPLEKMRKLQFEKLKKQMRYVYENSEFYRGKFDRFGAKPEDIRSLDDFRRLPVFITKEEHRACQEESLLQRLNV